MSEVERKLFECENNRVYSFPVNHCVFCKHCDDIIYDYSNGPYMFFCELDKEYKTCDGAFESDGYVFDEEDYKRRMRDVGY